MKFTHVAIGVAAIGLMWSMTVSTQPGPSQHLPVPAGFDFPADEAALLKLRDTGDVVGMRKHAWMVFAGMTQPAPGGEAIWETWWPSDQTFNSGATPQAAPRRHPRFSSPRQLSPARGVASALAVGASHLSFVLFNPRAHDFIRANKLYLTNTLDAIRASGAAELTDFPRDAMSVKTVWWPIARDALTPMPVWDAEPTRPILEGMRNPPPPPRNVGNNPDTWKRVVAIDASRTTIPAGETATVTFFDPSAVDPAAAPKIARPGSKVVALNRLYSFRLTAADIAASSVDLNAVFNSILGRAPRAGDAVALVCLHYTTKEIDDWVWSTFWWHDSPNSGSFAADRPAQVQGPWRNYLMDATFSMGTPVEPDGTPNSVFNPWLEARFSNGVKSNCMTCHQRAVWPPNDFLPVTRGGLKPGDPYFKNTTRLDFLWSIAFESK